MAAMESTKTEGDVQDVPLAYSTGDEDSTAVDDKGGNASDRRDMFRLGKVQELRRNFHLLSILSFSMILQASWEAILGVAAVGLSTSGSAGLIWIYFISWMGFIFINISMAEMASMAPTSGGQYHWISEFAPMKIQKFLSYLMGWLSVLGWQSACAATSYIAATMIQGIAVLNYPNYVAENWHGTLLTMAIALLGVFINTVLAKKLPMLEGLVLGIHIFAFFGILVTLWVLAPRHSAKDVFTQFTDGGNWGSMGVATLVGVSSGISPLLGADAATHMAEEIRDAGRNIPLAMLTTTVVNGIMGWVMTITFCFCLGSLTDILASPTGYPFIQVFYNVTGSAASATAMTSILIVINIFANMTTIATGSRQLYAFSRDKGFIFSSYFSIVSPSWELPMHAIWSTFIFSAVLSLINIGSPLALNSIISMATGANLSSYIVSIGCVCWRRLTGQPLLPSKFNLGRYGLLINLIAEAFLIVCFVFTFFPPAPHPDAPNMNWAIVAWGGVVCISLVHYYISGRHQYVGPVEYVRKLE